MFKEEKSPLIKEFVLIWEQLCALHQALYQITCKEYKLLLGGNMDVLEEYLERKIDIINKIKSTELKRQTYIEQLPSIEGISQLLDYIPSQELREYNDNLLDIIKKIQNQNQKNKIFINKAIYNLQKIKDEVLGHRSPTAYDSKGRTHQQSFYEFGVND